MAWSYKRVFLFVAILSSVLLSFSANRHPERLMLSDGGGYFVYLPSVFIYGDFVQEAVLDPIHTQVYPGTDKIFTKYTYGVALLEMPFFLPAHFWSLIAGDAADGKSAIYGIGIMMAGLFYFWISLLTLFRYGCRYFDKLNVVLALFCIVLGTNLYYYVFFQPSMSHIYSFFLFSLFLLFTDDLLIQKKYQFNKVHWAWIIYFFIFGMIILIRPTNIILGLWPLLIWFKYIGFRKFIVPEYSFLLVCGLFFCLPFLPQFIYWKYITGSWFLWSYGGETFIYWNNPKIFKVLFGAWNGWILYSPIVIFPIFYLFKGLFSNRNQERATLLILAIATYLFASWWVWWFGGAFGHRAYVEYLALLVLPFSGFINDLRGRKIFVWIFSLIFIIFCFYNLGLTYAYKTRWDGDAWTYMSLWNEITKLLFIK